MKINSVKTESIETHLADEGFTTTYGEEPSIRHHVIVRKISDSGITGIGEALGLRRKWWTRRDLKKLEFGITFSSFRLISNHYLNGTSMEQWWDV